ncbi:hydantoinase/oxoprolinase family protein [Actinophytocola gossypii]|uniref:Hydantoinase/oxoprolinase family protein n=1 Tax=Actinophytocola gossypii TaxID=2812003 RepID=A0ABT2J9D6_9PSEU|nr:hydantoinase/oxoprolinase family protein [Actinophytocola gossypii]MCT2584483.1 hydantoinase/oxoprolinase family protein [Actinophytocola gossypii]
MIRIGVDVGGTFTDVTALDSATGRFHVVKLPSTGDDQSIAVTEGIRLVLADADATPEQVDYLGHGTTVATNALLERKGATTALLVTAGVADVLEIARQRRPHLYDLFADKPPVLVPRDRTVPVAERIGASGEVVRELTDAEVDRVIETVRRTGAAAVAICLLHSYRSAGHEQRVEEALRERLPEVFVSRSSRVAPEFREYERFSTAVINSFVGPVVSRYVRRLSERVAATGLPVGPRVIQSNGGLASPEAVAERPVTVLLSGPSAGVVGAGYLAGLAGHRDLITFDMGGTSTDVCLVRGGRPRSASERGLGGYPIRVPSVDVHTIGAGGGSIASVDGAGGLRVGPESAGARPGPAAYGHGGTQPTTTDANVVRGRQNPVSALGGAMPIDRVAAERAVGTVAEGLGCAPLEAARSIGRLANSHMARAVRRVSVEAGEDPRDYVLMAYGGAGPLHAAEVAEEVGMTRLLVPPNPGTLCALGLLVSDVRSEFSRAFLRPAEAAVLPALNETIAGVVAEARAWLDREARIATRHTVTVAADARYPRQNFELRIALPSDELDEAALAAAIADFHAQHEKSYGFAHADAAVQLVNIRAVAHGEVAKPDLPRLPQGGAAPDPAALRETREADFGADHGTVPTPVFDRAKLLAGNTIAGPAIVEQLDSTTVVPPGWTATVDEFGNLLIEVIR